MITTEDKDAINDLFINTPNDFDTEDVSDIMTTPTLIIDLDEVNGEALRQAKIITERLSNYYFDEKYIEQHPYIPSKIAQEMDSVRRLLKMLSVNEKAQDALIANITMNAGKGALYSSLTSLQNSTLNIQSQLNTTITNIENIFREMQAECEKTFADKDKEISEDGSTTVRGSREFIKKLQEQMYGTTKVNEETGEITITTPISEQKPEQPTEKHEATAADILA